MLLETGGGITFCLAATGGILEGIAGFCPDGRPGPLPSCFLESRDEDVILLDPLGL